MRRTGEIMKIKALIMDVDGTLTDGGIYLDVNGNELKRFNVKDGYGIKNILRDRDIIPIILTGRESEVVKRRCQELGVEYIIQGSKNKVRDMKEILTRLDIPIGAVMYIGDDLNDMECMKLTGLCACPKDATREIKNICNYIAEKDGGYGAVREIIDWLDTNWRE